MIEEVNSRIAIGTRVTVKELKESGQVYEYGTSDSGHTVYGIEFDHSVYPKNFIPTTVWHCEREDLDVQG